MCVYFHVAMHLMLCRFIKSAGALCMQAIRFVRINRSIDLCLTAAFFDMIHSFRLSKSAIFEIDQFTFRTLCHFIRLDAKCNTLHLTCPAMCQSEPTINANEKEC